MNRRNDTPRVLIGVLCIAALGACSPEVVPYESNGHLASMATEQANDASDESSHATGPCWSNDGLSCGCQETISGQSFAYSCAPGPNPNAVPDSGAAAPWFNCTCTVNGVTTGKFSSGDCSSFLVDQLEAPRTEPLDGCAFPSSKASAAPLGSVDGGPAGTSDAGPAATSVPTCWSDPGTASAQGVCGCAQERGGHSVAYACQSPPLPLPDAGPSLVNQPASCWCTVDGVSAGQFNADPNACGAAMPALESAFVTPGAAPFNGCQLP
jgi:hypothetical protein